MSELGVENLIKDLESEYLKNFRKKIDEYYKKSIEDFQKNVTEYGMRKSHTYINWGDWETEKMLAKAVKEKLTEAGYYVTIHRKHNICIHLDRPKINVSLWKRILNKFK